MNPNNPLTPTQPETPAKPSTPTPEENAAIQALENIDTPASDLNVPAEMPAPTPSVSPVPETPQPTPIVGQDIVPPAPKESPTPVPAEPIAASPAFNPFEAKAVELGKKKSKKTVVILGVILLIVGLGAGGYFVWAMMQPAPAPAVTLPATSPETTEEVPVETPADVTSEIDAIEQDLNAIDETELQDSTISDQTLSQ